LETVLSPIHPASFPDFSQMSANLVRYCSTGGFDDGGNHFQSSSPYLVTWEGIFNEPDINGLSAQQYPMLCNTVVPLMRQADPSIKFVAAELAGSPLTYFPISVGGVTDPADAVAKHFYSACFQRDLDRSLFATIPGFAANVRAMYSDMAINPALAGVPVRITENNVNADYNQGNRISSLALIFEQLGEAGAQALYHWDFGTDAQYCEIDGDAKPYLSYWVDYYLSHWLPSALARIFCRQPRRVAVRGFRTRLAGWSRAQARHPDHGRPKCRWLRHRPDVELCPARRPGQ
jgi:hypothetical protein